MLIRTSGIINVGAKIPFCQTISFGSFSREKKNSTEKAKLYYVVLLFEAREKDFIPRRLVPLQWYQGIRQARRNYTILKVDLRGMRERERERERDDFKQRQRV